MTTAAFWQICDQFEAAWSSWAWGFKTIPGGWSQKKNCLGLRCIRQERLIDQLKQVKTNSQDRAGGPWLPWFSAVCHGDPW